MIPKKIHYCWFGGGPLPAIAEKCMKSWRIYCPDYEIIRWDESNCDFNINQFVRQASRAKKWAFVSDYFRLKVVEEYGGVYLDIDVELLKSLDSLLGHEGFMGFELGENNSIATGLGFGAIAHHPIITKLRENYEHISFIKPDGTFDTMPCPRRDTKILVKLGLLQNNKKQTISGITFYPSDYFSPLSFYGSEDFSENTYSIHHFNASWATERQFKARDRRIRLRKVFGKKLADKIDLIFLVYDELRHGGFRGLLAKIKDRR